MTASTGKPAVRVRLFEGEQVGHHQFTRVRTKSDEQDGADRRRASA